MNSLQIIGLCALAPSFYELSLGRLEVGIAYGTIAAALIFLGRLPW